jgi:uncharacterized protein
MMLPALVEEEIKEKGYAVNFYRRKKIKDKYLLTTDQGTWVCLDTEDYRDFLNGRIQEQIRSNLIERGLIITPENYEQIVTAYYKRYQHIQNAASLHIIVPTIRCNLCCIYCHSEAESFVKGLEYDMDEETLKRTLEFIFKTPKQRFTIEFQGGEPLLNKPMVRKTIEYAAELNKRYQKEYRISLVSNLLKMDNEFLDFLIEHKHNLSLCTSLDGPRVVHDMNRKFIYKNLGTYDRVTDKIELCRERGFKVGLLMVTTKHSLPYWKEIVDEYVKWENKEIQIKPLDYLGYAVNIWDEIGYSMDEFVEFWTKAVDYTFELMNQGVLLVERHLKLALQNILNPVDAGYVDWTNPCGLLRGQIVYNYNGNIYCCDEARVMQDCIVGNVYQDKYVNLIKNAKANQLMKSSILEGHYCDSCVYKPFCGVCPVLHYGQEKNYFIKLNKTNRCELNRTVLDYAFEKLLFERTKIQKLIIGMKVRDKLSEIH